MKPDYLNYQSIRRRTGTRRGAGILSAWLLCLLAAGAVRADDIADAVAVVADLQQALVAVAARQPPLSLAERYRELTPVIERTHDLDYMARFAVRRHWQGWTDEALAAYLEAFARLSITTYASRFATAGPDTFELQGGEADRDGRVRVSSLIHRREGEPVALDYLLAPGEAGWRIVMDYADDISELALKRSRYEKLLREAAPEDGPSAEAAAAAGLQAILADIEAAIGELE